MRIQIDFPPQVNFITTISVRVNDLNYGNHLGNDRLLIFAHEARMQFLQNLGYQEMDIEGLGIIMADAGIQYKSEAFYGEEIIIEIAISNFTRVSFDIFYRMKCESRLVALVKTGIIFFDYNQRKICSVPPKFRERFV